MGRAVYEQSARAREIFEEADRTVGYELSKICFDGPSGDLDSTTVAQPAILTTSVAILEAFRRRFVRALWQGTRSENSRRLSRPVY